ncbi:hypothetical protein [Achromobacter insolitus]|uniref:hypothetical protein n=1 Tax=Achromobacter insolitus TaxID=217204 RepID=UPI003B9A64D2
MQPNYEPYVALYKYGLNTALAMAESYFDSARQLRALQLKTDKEMLAFAQQAHAEMEAMSTVAAICSYQQKLAADLLGREMDYLREIEKIARAASASASATLRDSKNPWQERVSEVAFGVGQFLANGNAMSSAGGKNA